MLSCMKSTARLTYRGATWSWSQFNRKLRRCGTCSKISRKAASTRSGIANGERPKSRASSMPDAMVCASRLKVAPAPVDRSRSGARSSLLNVARSNIAESTLDTISTSNISVTLAYSPPTQRSLMWCDMDVGASNAVSGGAVTTFVPTNASATPAIGRMTLRRSSFVLFVTDQSAVYLFRRNTPNLGSTTTSDFQRKLWRGLGGDALNVGTCDWKLASKSSNAVPERDGCV